MPCCIDWRRIIAGAAAALALGLWPAAPAQDAPPAAEEAPAAAPAGEAADEAAEDAPAEGDDDTPLTPAQEALERLRHGVPDVATLAEVLPLLPQPAHRGLIRAKTVDAKPPPRAELVALLEHPYLAVRLGALELLEEMAGTDHAFNPWQPNTTPDNAAAIARWRAWAGKKDAPAAAAARVFSDDQRRSYLRDIMGDDADKAARGRRMLEADGFAAIGFLESFLAETRTLTPGARARIREAQYQITLARQIGDGAADLARQLAFGSRDQLLAALGAIGGSGPLALPILRDFITHPDALVRETAIDAMLVTSGEEAVKIIAPLMDQEPDANVIHGMLRRIKDIKCAASEELAARFLRHANEDLLISAIQTCLSLSGDTDSWSGSATSRKRPDQDAAIIECLSDPRWRVRAAALEYVARRRPAAAKQRVLELLDDADSFVRQGAVAAAVAMKLRDALPKLQAMARADITVAPLVVAAFESMERKLDADTAARIRAAPAGVQLEAIQASQSFDFISSFAASSDLDLACAALRWIAADADRVKMKSGAAYLLAALRSDDPARVAAVLDRLALPAARSSERGFALAGAFAGGGARLGEPTALDPLYDAFLLPGRGPEEVPGPAAAAPVPSGGLAELTRELLRFTAAELPVEQRFSAALNLAAAGHVAGLEALARDFGELDTSRKVELCQALGMASDKRALELLVKLLRDPVSEVRSAAAECCLGGRSRAALNLVLEELSRPDAPLQAHEVYGYRLESIARSNAGWLTPWILERLENDDAPVPQRILALILSRSVKSTRLVAAVRGLVKSPDPNIRRAAWQALLTMRSGEASANAKAIAGDPEARVRLVLPDRMATTLGNWRHQFTDTIGVDDNLSEYDRRLPRLDAEATAVLERMAKRDPSPVVRFEAAFALVARGVAVDFDEFARLLGKQPDTAQARYRITRWLENNASRATPALRPLLALADTSRIPPREMAVLNQRVAPARQAGFATFASLAAQGAEGATAPGQPLLAPEEDTAKPEPRDSLTVVYFHKPGCPECARAREMLDEWKRDFPLLEVVPYNIVEPTGTLLNQTLCDRFHVPANRHTVAPAVFAQGGFLVKDIAHRELGELLSKTMKLPQDDAWRAFDEATMAAADVQIERRYRAITLPMVLLGGLIDGLNPCAFATIIFFLSYLQIARRTPREMLLVGAAFIAAVFLAYLAAGLLLHEVLDWIYTRVGGVRVWLTYGFAGLALVAAGLSVRDALLARAGRLDEMTLQLPGLLKDRIKGVIRGGARARRFVIAAFLSGLVVSLLELACTGQVYAPIIYQIRQGELNAVNWLLLYNLAFILPLVVIFLLAYGGLRSEALIGFQRRHTFTVKLALAAVFLALAVFIVLGDRLLPDARRTAAAAPPATAQPGG